GADCVRQHASRQGTPACGSLHRRRTSQGDAVPSRVADRLFRPRIDRPSPTTSQIFRPTLGHTDCSRTVQSLADGELTIPPLIPSLSGGTLTLLVPPTSCGAFATAAHFSRTSQINQQLPYPFPANARTRPFDVRHPELSKLSTNGSKDHFCLRPFGRT